MLVEVVRLREDGVKLTREQIRAAQPWRAEVWICRMGNGVVRANYGPPGGSCSYYLEPAAIVTMHGTEFLVVGLEKIGKWGAERLVPQAWWCRLASDQQPAADRSGGPAGEAASVAIGTACAL
jgi:hypothetical protein